MGRATAALLRARGTRIVVRAGLGQSGAGRVRLGWEDESGLFRGLDRADGQLGVVSIEEGGTKGSSDPQHPYDEIEDAYLAIGLAAGASAPTLEVSADGARWTTLDAGDPMPDGAGDGAITFSLDGDAADGATLTLYSVARCPR
jgi:hypothetical protein